MLHICTPIPCPAQPRRDAPGFTLLEVLVAVTIAALMLTALLHSFSAGLGGSVRAESWTAATVIAQSTIDTLGAADPLAETDLQREEGPFHVAASVHRYPSPDRAGVLAVPFELAVTVSWRDGLRTRSFELRTLRLGALNSDQDQ